jgi:hypothetical protein
VWQIAQISGFVQFTMKLKLQQVFVYSFIQTFVDDFPLPITPNTQNMQNTLLIVVVVVTTEVMKNYLQGYTAVKCVVSQQTFRMKITPPSPGFKSKLGKNPALYLRYLNPGDS